MTASEENGSLDGSYKQDAFEFKACPRWDVFT